MKIVLTVSLFFHMVCDIFLGIKLIKPTRILVIKRRVCMSTKFTAFFDEWAETYDNSINGENLQYREVFKNYHYILNTVSKSSFGNILEFGVGTGNLSGKLLDMGYNVTGVEPSKVMAEKALQKYPSLDLHEGDFLNFPDITHPIHTIVSTYAFHHITDREKEKAITKYAKLLSPHGKIIFADTIFETEEHKTNMIEKAVEQNYLNLATDLQSEYYTTIPVLNLIFNKAGFHVVFEKMNDFVWLMLAVKK